MKRWPTMPLGEVCEFVRGISFKPTDLVEAGSPNSLACFRTKNVQVELEADDLIHIPRSFVKTDRQLVREGDALISTANSNNLVGKCCFVPRLDYPATLGGFIAAVRSNPKRIQPRFLYYWLSSPFTQYRLRGLARQTTNISNLPLMDVAKEPAPVPPLPEQKRIVKLLDAAEELRRLRAEADRRTADLIPALFYEMFGDPATNAKRWLLSNVGDLLTSCDYGTSQKANEKGQGVPVLRMNNVTYAGTIDLRELKHVLLAEKELKKQRLAAGDVLFNRTNSRDLVGKTCYWDGRFEAVAASYFIRVRFDPEKENWQHFTTFMNLPFMKSRLEEMARGAVGQANINAQELRAISFPVPPISLQRQFAARVTEIQALEARQAESRRRLDDLFQSLLHRAFRGEL